MGDFPRITMGIHWRFAIASLMCLLLACLPLGAQRTLTLPPADVGEPRIALVIGNANYKGAPLLNPVNDANDIAQALRELGFKVFLLRDANTREMRQAIREWSTELRRAKVGLFYFAGHGVQIRGSNYILPVATDLESEADVEDLAIDANYALRTMEEAQTDVSILILDACRNNPFSRNFRSASRGLAQMAAAKGTVIAFSTAPGSVASDGVGRNGTYTRSLLESLRHSDSDILRVFQRTRASVLRETGGKQMPWESTSLIGEFHFRIQGTGSVQIAQSIQMAPPPSPPAALSPRVDDAAEGGSEAAQFSLAQMYYHGWGAVPKDYAAAFRSFRLLADRGNPDAISYLAMMYENGWGVAQSDSEALRLHGEAAERGITNSMNSLATFYEKGRGVKKDEAAAARLYRKAAESGNFYAMYNLGALYRDGNGVSRDDEESARWIERAADKGLAIAMVVIGAFYTIGRGVKEDKERAKAWYRKAIAAAGNNEEVRGMAEKGLRSLER